MYTEWANVEVEQLIYRMTRFLLVFLSLAVVLAGCVPCEPFNEVHLAEDFEGCDQLCGWQIAGEGRIVSTVHSAESALWLGAGASASLDVNLTISEQSLNLEMVSNTSGLKVELDWETSSGLATQVLTIVPCEAGADADFRLLCADAAANRPADASQLLAFRIETSTGCTIDRLYLWTRRGGGGC